MKKIFTLELGLMMGMTMMSEPFAVRVNGTTDYTANPTGEVDFQGRTQYAALGVTLQAGDQLTCYDGGSGAEWNIAAIDQYGAYTKFSVGASALSCNVAGTYNIYIKMKMNDDMWYIEDASSVDPGPGPQPGGEGNPRFMRKAELDGEWQEPSASTTFVNATCNISFYTSAYLFLIYQVDGVAGVEYMCESYTTDTHARFVKGGTEKWGVPVGTTTLYLYDNGDGSVEVSNQVMPGKTPWTAGDVQGIDNTTVSDKARKTIVDGQLRIIRGDKIFDATGRQL